MKTKYIRWSRIIKHSIQYILTMNKVYEYEIMHYYYCKKFNQTLWHLKKKQKSYLINTMKLHNQLNGQTMKISVGAPTQAERQELKLRIEDAVCAAQTALEYGVLPGGGVFLRDFDPAGYLAEPFKLLTDRSPVEYKPGSGVDIARGELVDNMVDAGIVDSAKAIEEAVINAHSAAAQLLSVRLALPFLEDME